MHLTQWVARSSMKKFVLTLTWYADAAKALPVQHTTALTSKRSQKKKRKRRSRRRQKADSDGVRGESPDRSKSDHVPSASKPSQETGRPGTHPESSPVNNDESKISPSSSEMESSDSIMSRVILTTG